MSCSQLRSVWSWPRDNHWKVSTVSLTVQNKRFTSKNRDIKWSLGTTTTLPEAVSKLIRFSALHEYVPESETFKDFNMKVAPSTISLLVSKVDPSLSQLMLGLGWPVAAHVNLRSEPSSIAVDLGPWVIFTGTADQIVWVTNNVPVK